MTSQASDPAAPAPTAQPVIDAPFRCPDAHAEPINVVDHGADTLPTGARSARLCLHDNNTAWAPPRGVLTSGSGRVIQTVNAQPVHDPRSDVACGGVGAPAWSMVFRYADGTRTITGDNGGCWDLLVGSTEREGSKAVFESYLHALVRQRSHEQPPAFHRAAPHCPARPRLDMFGPVADAATAQVGALCIWQDHRARRVPLRDAQLAMLRHDFSTASRREVAEDAQSRCSQPRRRSSSCAASTAGRSRSRSTWRVGRTGSSSPQRRRTPSRSCFRAPPGCSRLSGGPDLATVTVALSQSGG